MTFHPDHMKAGVQAALNSPNTPAHLKPHLQKRLAGAMPMKPKMPNPMPNGPMMPGAMPAMNVAPAAMPVKGIPKPTKAPKAGKRTKITPQQVKPILPPAFYGR